jgi:hypothetical protein
MFRKKSFIWTLRNKTMIYHIYVNKNCTFYSLEHLTLQGAQSINKATNLQFNETELQMQWFKVFKLK